jgi:prefoldin subunit 5
VNDFREYFCSEIDRKLEDMRKTQHEIELISDALSELNSPSAELERLRGAYDEALSQLGDGADIEASINESENIIREEGESIRGVLSEFGLETDVHSAVKTIKQEIERLGNPGKRESELKGQLTAKRNILSELEGLENELEAE